MHPYLWREVIYLQTHQCPYIKGVPYLKETRVENWIEVKGTRFLKNLRMIFSSSFYCTEKLVFSKPQIKKNKKHVLMIIDNQIQTQILKSFEIQTVWSKHCPFWTNKDCSTCILLRHVYLLVTNIGLNGLYYI
jgi:hypothetical protein